LTPPPAKAERRFFFASEFGREAGVPPSTTIRNLSQTRLLERQTCAGTEARQPRSQAAQFEEIIMSNSATFVRHKAKPGKRDEIRRVWERYARDYVAGSKGALSYYYCYDDNDPDAIVVFGLATDQASGQDFLKQPWFGDYQRETAALVVGPSEVRTLTPQWAKGAA
jgi:quinol monooxygenase YgiN